MHKPMADFPVSFANLLRARFPYIYVGTWEEERVLGLIREVARDAKLVRTLAPRLKPLMPNVQDVWADLMTPSPQHFVPKRYEEMLNGFL